MILHSSNAKANANEWDNAGSLIVAVGGAGLAGTWYLYDVCFHSGLQMNYGR